jgi:hypothetical protein
MVTTAVVLAGMPASIGAHVVQALRNRFNDGYVFRAPAAPSNRAPLASYSASNIDHILESARDAVFGSTKRPSSFCRNPTHSCVLKGRSKKHCNKMSNEACFLVKPDFLVVMYQRGMNESNFIERLHYCAHLVEIPDRCYGRLQKTIEFVVSTLHKCRTSLRAIRDEISSKNSLLLLPPLNFTGREIERLLKSACYGTIDSRPFRRDFYSKGTRGYLGRKRQLAFKLSEAGGQHGTPGPQDRADLALTRHHRAGSSYPGNWHYDVTRVDGRDFDGSIKFFCRDNATIYPKGVDHVNVLVDDCVR